MTWKPDFHCFVQVSKCWNFWLHKLCLHLFVMPVSPSSLELVQSWSWLCSSEANHILLAADLNLRPSCFENNIIIIMEVFNISVIKIYTIYCSLVQNCQFQYFFPSWLYQVNFYLLNSTHGTSSKQLQEMFPRKAFSEIYGILWHFCWYLWCPGCYCSRVLTVILFWEVWCNHEMFL